MKKRFALVSLLTILLSACFDSNGKTTAKSIKASNTPLTLNLSPAFNKQQFERPIAALQTATLDWFIVEQGGRIYRLDKSTQEKSLFLDFSQKIKSRGEMGLLGFAIDSNFKSNGIFYISYTGFDNYSYISRLYAEDNTVDKNSEEIILKVAQPYSNHNGGQITFGPDGYLYIALGDGGSAGDPENNGQNLETLLGSILRIDVNNKSPYSIPSSNPFVEQAGKDEIFAYGLRNPWRWSFDKLTGDLWVADVGQNAWEEINILTKGGNFGWNILEGKHCFTVGECKAQDFISPVYEYSHNEGQSITGGYVYRGNKIPALDGYYIYGDFVSGKIWALKLDDNGVPNNQVLFETNKNISSFAQDRSGEIYVIDYNGGIYEITP